MSFLLKVAVNAVALWVAAWLIDGITLADDSTSTTATVITVGVVALIFGVLNAVIRPVLMILSVPLLVLTLGLFTFMVNAAMLSLTSWLSGLFGLDFHVAEFFWDAVLGALVVTVVSLVLEAVLPDGR